MGLAATLRVSEKQRRVEVLRAWLACCVWWRARRVLAVGRPRGRRKGGICAGDMVIESVTTGRFCGFLVVERVVQ